MRRHRILVAGLLLSSCSVYGPDGGPTAGVLPDAQLAESETFRSISEAYIAWNYAVHPTWATADGVHEHDGQLGIWTREAVEGRLSSLRRYQRRILAVDPAALDDEAFYDHRVLNLQIAAAILDLQDVRSWEKNPNFYRNIISGGLYTLAALAFDSPERRMVLAAERLNHVPEVVAAAKENLSRPPRIFTEVAIEEFRGTRAFLKTSLPQAFASVKDEAIRARFLEAQNLATSSIETFIDWMRKDLLLASTGSFALGPELFHRKVALEEGIDTPAEELLSRGYDLLHATQERMKQVAGDRPVKALLRETSREHPSADKLLAYIQSMLVELKAWASGVVAIPANAECRVQETPEFRRSLSFASMETPGPFERVAREAYYSITLPDPSWTMDRQEQHLSFFNHYSLPLISVHKAFPGHYTQFLALQNCPSKVRKIFGCGSFSEGWAHYCEQLYLESQADPPMALRLHQLQLSLVRICRYIAGIELHTKDMTIEQAIELFVNEGYMERVAAEREARRGASDPTYLVYTLGKQEILKLRDEYMARRSGTLKSFHEDLLRHGYPPIPIVRQILFKER